MKLDLGEQHLEVLDDQVVYQGFHQIRRLKLRHRLFNGGWSEVFEREVSSKGSAACAIVYDPQSDSVCLVQQFRIATRRAGHSPWILEVVAGMIDKDSESAEQVITRELLEEAGIKAQYLEKITSYWVSPGGSSARMHIFVVLCDLTNAGGNYGLSEEHEDILALVLPRETVYQSALAEESGNAATLIGLQWLTLNRQRMYHIWQNKLSKQGES